MSKRTFDEGDLIKEEEEELVPGCEAIPEAYLKANDSLDQQIAKRFIREQKRQESRSIVIQQQQDGQEEEEGMEEDVRGEDLFSMSMSSRGPELFHMERFHSEANKLFPLDGMLWSAYYEKTVIDRYGPNLLMSLLPIAVPTPPLLMLFLGGSHPLYMSSFEVLACYSALIKCVSASFGQLILNRRRLLLHQLLRLNEKGALRQHHIEKAWQSCAGATDYATRHQRRLPKLSRLEELSVRKQDEAEEKQLMLVDQEEEEEEEVHNLQVEPKPMAVDDITLAQVLAKLESEQSLPIEYIYRVVADVPRLAPLEDAGDDAHWARADLCYSDDLLQDMLKQQDYNLSAMEGMLEDYLRTPTPPHHFNATDGTLLINEFLSQLNHSLTVQTIRLREMTLMSMLARCTLHDRQALEERNQLLQARCALLREDVLRDWLMPEHPLLQEVAINEKPIFHTVPGELVNEVIGYRLFLLRKRNQLIASRTVIKPLYCIASNRVPLPSDDDDDELSPKAVMDQGLPTPWSLTEAEARMHLKFMGRTYQNEEHRQTLLSGAIENFSAECLKWHQNKMQIYFDQAVTHALANRS